MLREFLRWWAAQLLACVPARLRPTGGLFAATPVVEWRAGPSLALLDRRGAVAETLKLTDSQQFRAAGSGVVLRLPTPLLLEREVRLPQAAARDPERVVGYEIDRLTPFRAEDVYWACDNAILDKPRGQIVLRLSLIAKAAARPMLEALEKLGTQAVALEATRADGGTCRIALDHLDPARRRRERRQVAALAALAGVLALGLLAAPFLRQSMAASALEAKMAALRPAVAEVDRIRRGFANEAGSADAISAERAALGDPIAALAAVTAILPDDTFLQEFSLAQRKLALRGSSAGAARLIGALAQDGQIRNPSFAAPVTRLENGQAELFSIRADWGP